MPRLQLNWYASSDQSSHVVGFGAATSSSCPVTVTSDVRSPETISTSTSLSGSSIMAFTALEQASSASIPAPAVATICVAPRPRVSPSANTTAPAAVILQPKPSSSPRLIWKTAPTIPMAMRTTPALIQGGWSAIDGGYPLGRLDGRPELGLRVLRIYAATTRNRPSRFWTTPTRTCPSASKSSRCGPFSGGAAYAYGGDQLVTGGARTIRGAGQFGSLQPLECDKDQTVGDNVSRFFRGVLPRGNSAVNLLGGLA